MPTCVPPDNVDDNDNEYNNYEKNNEKKKNDTKTDKNKKDDDDEESGSSSSGSSISKEGSGSSGGNNKVQRLLQKSNIMNFGRNRRRRNSLGDTRNISMVNIKEKEDGKMVAALEALPLDDDDDNDDEEDPSAAAAADGNKTGGRRRWIRRRHSSASVELKRKDAWNALRVVDEEQEEYDNNKKNANNKQHCASPSSSSSSRRRFSRFQNATNKQRANSNNNDNNANKSHDLDMPLTDAKENGGATTTSAASTSSTLSRTMTLVTASPLKQSHNNNTNDPTTTRTTATTTSSSTSTTTPSSSCWAATSILQHSYVSQPCFVGDSDCNPAVWCRSRSNTNVQKHQTRFLSEDPTIQESIECVFSYQLEDGSLGTLLLSSDDDDDYEEEDSDGEEERGDKDHRNWELQLKNGGKKIMNAAVTMKRHMVSTTSEQQTRSKEHTITTTTTTTKKKSLTRTTIRNKKQKGSIMHLGTFNPRLDSQQYHLHENGGDDYDTTRQAQASSTSSQVVTKQPPASPPRMAKITALSSLEPSSTLSAILPVYTISSSSCSNINSSYRNTTTTTTNQWNTNNNVGNIIASPHFKTKKESSCPSCRLHKTTPSMPPSLWPQRPLLIRPTPQSGTRVIGVRYVNSIDYLWHVGDNDNIVDDDDDSVMTTMKEKKEKENKNGGGGSRLNKSWTEEGGKMTMVVPWFQRLQQEDFSLARDERNKKKKNSIYNGTTNGMNKRGNVLHSNDKHNNKGVPTTATTTTGSNDTSTSTANTKKCWVCPECTPLPINNGNEPQGRSLVIDFESPLFIGTLLVRIRYATGTIPPNSPYNDTHGYFAGMNRRYQAVIRGQFKHSNIPMTECITGQALDRPCGKLPPKWMLKSAVKVVGFFAPQMHAKFDGNKPVVTSPLGSTPQAIRADRIDPNGGTSSNDKRNTTSNSHDNDDTSTTSGQSKQRHRHRPPHMADITLEEPQEEPSDDKTSLLPHLPPHTSASDASTSLSRARVRKKAFDKLYASGYKTPTFRTDTIYTFEFLQHLLNFHDLSIELGSVLGKLQLRDVLDGQPLKFMAAHQNQQQQHQHDTVNDSNGGGAEKTKMSKKNKKKGRKYDQREDVNDDDSNNDDNVIGRGDEGSRSDLDYIWSFDIWHECLVDAARRHDAHKDD